MKNLKIILTSMCIFLMILACKKEEPPGPPVLTTDPVSEITYYGATTGGTITDDGGEEITARGVCWSTSSTPTTADNKTEDGEGSGSFTSKITGLDPETPYYVRAYAVNSVGTSYGNEVSFTSGPLTDIDGNTYNTVIIGDQVWMQENLKVTKLNNGTQIPLVEDNDTWLHTDDPGHSWYDNDEDTYGDTYGAFYNWYTVNTGKLCPDGWHVPSDEEWTALTDFLGGEDVAGGKLKEAGIEHWDSPNTDATNETGFTGLPGGYRSNGGQYYSMGWTGNWWTSTIVDDGWDTFVYSRRLRADLNSVYRSYSNKNFGRYVRCIKDQYK
ncbi:MAG: fibrobacter succinogenes major paralogous domain-containing protein [Bacteroidales bacterium]|nr:fibrobacter succinogenes major paralogous domain-containing protein [Bacteroidales bacterium]